MNYSDQSNNSLFLNTENLALSFGTSAPENKIRINSSYTKLVSTNQIYCTGDAYIFGKIKTPLNLEVPITFSDGSLAAPSVTFTSNGSVGLYKPAQNSLGLVAQDSIILNSAEIQCAGAITSPGNITLRPTGPYIDCSGATLINVSGVAINAGPPGNVVIVGPDSSFSSEATLATSRGGTGINTVGATGIARVLNGTWSIGTINDADIALTASVSRAKIASGTFGHVLINDSTTGAIISEATLATSRGGTGINTVGATGIARVQNGAWSIGTVTDADISSTASVSRAKIAPGTANRVVINDSTGLLTSESALAPIRGGTGVSSASSNGIPHVQNGVWTFSKIIATDIGNLSSLSVGSVFANALVTSSIEGINGAPYLDVIAPVNFNGGLFGSLLLLKYVTTTDGTATPILTLATDYSTVYSLECLISAVSQDTPPQIGTFSFIFNALNYNGALTVNNSPIITSATTGYMSSASVTTQAVAQNLIVNVTGVAGKTIKWTSKFNVLNHNF